MTEIRAFLTVYALVILVIAVAVFVAAWHDRRHHR